MAFYCKLGLACKQVPIKTEIECCVYEVELALQTITVCILYRNQKFRLSNFFPVFEDLLYTLKSSNREIFVFGDFNIDILKDSIDKVKYESLLSAYDFQFCNFEPTRVTPKSKTCLDHFPSSKNYLTETIKSTISDHFSVILKIADEKSENCKKMFKHRNLMNLKGDNSLNFLFILDQKLKKMPPDCDSDGQFSFISKTIMECVNRFAPEKEYCQKNDCSNWITNQVKNAMNKRDKMFQKWVCNPSEENHELYKKQRNNVTAIIRKAKRAHNFEKLGKNPSSKTIYRTLKSHKKENPNDSDYPDLDALNKHFTSIGPLLSSKLPLKNYINNITTNENSMVIFNTDRLEVMKVISKLKNKKSYGHDGISNEILKCCSPIIEPYLANAFNKAISESVYPTSLKKAKVVPLFKKGDKKNPENYRPISLLSSLSKVFEKLLFERMVNFCEKNKLLTSAQFGFRSKRSCADAILTVTEFMRDEVDKKSTGVVCFIDLQKAFDTLDHDILLHKLNEYGFRGEVNNLLRSYLQNRLQYINVDGKATNSCEIKTGVPQGSILGPLLFLLYINDLTNCDIQSKIALFADDTSLVKAGKKNECKIIRDINLITDWYTSNKLSVNIDNCEGLTFGSGELDEVKIMGKIVPRKIIASV